MREAMFIKKNAQKWQEYQHLQTDDPDETADRFINLMDDLSYAKTFYPHSKVTRWINSLSVSIYQSLYRNKKEKFSRIGLFFKKELPLTFQKYHRIFLFTFIVFFIFCLMGVLSSMKDENFIRGVLGDEYVQMTEDNIAKGDPFGVYKDESYFSMFIRIAFNNIKVDFYMFIGGILFGLVTMWLLFNNSIMLGCFQYLFFAKGLGWKSVLVIWIHGTLEISAMVVASTAGFILGSSLIFTGTFKRNESFTRGVKDAMKIVLALVPITLFAAFLESYVTHLMSQSFDKDLSTGGIPVWGSALILLSSLVFIIWYFIIYPIKINRKEKRLYELQLSKPLSSFNV
ncbi:MAG: stage II sporulation protein M [Sphingobacteriales bacterium]|nr:stage II sporulation protein M [Sphingobacteriales bacterium]